MQRQVVEVDSGRWYILEPPSSFRGFKQARAGGVDGAQQRAPGRIAPWTCEVVALRRRVCSPLLGLRCGVGLDMT